MQIIELIMAATAVMTGTIATVCDMHRSIVPNKLIVIAAGISTMLSAIYYGAFAQDLAVEYLLNIAIVALISVLLYGFHIWGGGDSKLIIVLALVHPARWYAYIQRELFPLINLFALIFSIGFLYTVAETLLMQMSRKSLAFPVTKFNLKQFTRDYLMGIIYVTAVSSVLRALVPGIFLANPVLTVLFNFFLVYCIFSFKIFFVPWVIGIAGVLCVSSWIVYRPTFTVSTLYVYAIVIVVMMLRRRAEAYNYLTIPADKLERGMILSITTVAQMNSSKLKNTPRKMTEDLRSKLTQEEVEATVAWGLKRPEFKVTIVRKIPFAVFISLGYILFLIWGVYHAVIFQ